MNISDFIAQCRLQWPEFQDSGKLSRDDHPSDRAFAGLPTEIQGMATENKLMLLNLAVKNLVADEVYVEIGCWHGLSLAGALLQNPGAKAYACDDFSQFNGTRAQLDKTIEQYTVPGQVRFHDMDFVSFLESAPWQPARIGVYFYDGGHSFKQQYQALENVLPWLADKALVIIDDTNAGQVRSANKRFMSRQSSFRILADLRTPGNEYPTWWNGVQIYSYEASMKQCSPPKRGLSYHAAQLCWDRLMPPLGEVVGAGRRLAGTIPGARSLSQYFRRRRALRRAS